MKMTEIILTAIMIAAIIFIGLVAYGSRNTPHPYAALDEYQQSH